MDTLESLRSKRGAPPRGAYRWCRWRLGQSSFEVGTIELVQFLLRLDREPKTALNLAPAGISEGLDIGVILRAQRPQSKPESSVGV